MNRAEKVQNKADKTRAEKKQERLCKNKEALEIKLKLAKKKNTKSIKKEIKKLAIETGINEVEIKVLDKKTKESEPPLLVGKQTIISNMTKFVYGILFVAIVAALFIGNA